MKIRDGLSAIAGTIAVLFVAGTGCTSEYFLGEDSFDRHITVGGDSLVFPVGTTDSITIDQFLDLSDVEYLHKDADGNFYFSISEPFGESVTVEEYAEGLSVDGFSKTFDDISFTVPAGLSSGTQAGTVYADIDFENEFVYKFSFKEAKDSGLVRLTKVWLQDSYLVPYVSISSDRPIPSSMRMTLHVEAPEKYVFEGDVTGDIVFEGPVDVSGKVDFKTASLTCMNLNLKEDDSFEFEDPFKLVRMSLSVDESDAAELEGAVLGISSELYVGGDDGKLHPSAFLGKADIDLDKVVKEISLEDIPDYLKNEDVCLDFYSPYAQVSLTANVSVPFIIDASVNPYFESGSSQVSPLQFSIDAPVSEDASVMETVSYWLSEEMPSELPQGYTWINADLGSIVNRIPDRLDVSILAYSDMSNPDEDDYVDCNADYAFDGELAFTLPMSFGENLYVPVRETIPDMPEELKSSLQIADISIMGEVMSTFPISVRVSAYFLDAAGTPLDIAVSTQEISSSDASGEPVASPLNLTATKSELAEYIDSMVLEFELLPGSVPGVSISDASWIQAEIALGIPGGLTLELESEEN